MTEFEQPLPRRAKLVTVVPIIATILASVFGAASPGEAAEAFNALKGRWAGSGSASFAGGQTEKLRCSAQYSGGGSSLALNLRCASSSAQINLSGSLDASGNKVSGDWNESSYGLSGSANGSSNGGSIRLRISGSLSGFMTLSVSGNRHTVALSSQGSTLSGVNVTMARK